MGHPVVHQNVISIDPKEDGMRMREGESHAEESPAQTWLTGKNAVPVRLNQLGQDDVNNCLACVARLAHLAQSQ